MNSIYDSTGRGFKICYYVSSLLPQYFILLLAFISENLENNFPPDIYSFITLKKFVFYLLVIIFLVGIWCLNKVKKDIYDVHDYINILGHYDDVKLSYRVNPGIGEFFLNILVPIILALPSINLPFSSFVIIISIQIVAYFFYTSSTDIFPNLSLWIIGYNIYKVKSTNKFNKSAYILGKTKRSDTKYYSGKTVSVIPFVAKNNESKFALIDKVISNK